MSFNEYTQRPFINRYLVVWIRKEEYCLLEATHLSERKTNELELDSKQIVPL